MAHQLQRKKLYSHSVFKKIEFLTLYLTFFPLMAFTLFIPEGYLDTEAPSVPQNVTASNITQTTVDLGWDASTDDVAVVGYYVYQSGSTIPVDTVMGTSTTIGGLAVDGTYQFAVSAFDAAGNVSGQSQAIQISTSNINSPPTASFTAIPTFGIAPLVVSFDASASSDPSGFIVSYEWDFGDGNTGTGVTVDHTYTAVGTFTAQLVVSDDSGASDIFIVKITVTESPDLEAPTTPQDLIASGITNSTVDLSWAASTDNIGILGYIVYQDGNPVDTVSGENVSVGGLNPGTTYQFSVAALDGSGNLSNSSQAIQVTTECDIPPIIRRAGPFFPDEGIQQLEATPAGGSWSGSANSDASFDPSQGEGFYPVYYSYFDSLGCGGTDTFLLEVLPIDTLCPSRTNLALNKATEQSSTYGNGVSSIAVDGNTTGSSPWAGDLQHTLTEFQPWWQVDLGNLANIQKVLIYNRTDCCQGRLNNFYVLWSNQPFDSSATLDQLLLDPDVGKVNFSGSAGLEENLFIGAEGRYVRIQHTREIQMHLAEVEVIGCISENDPCFNAQKAVIDPIPPLAPNSGVYPLSGLPAGGFWSGDANADGTFTTEACPGTYEAIYTFLNGGECETADTVSILVQADTMEVFIYAGQSNATGAQNTLEVLEVGNSPYDSQIAYAWNIPEIAISAGWDTLQAVETDSMRRGHGAEISFGRALFEAGYNNLGLIKVALGGTNLANHWDPNTSLPGVDGFNGMYPEMVNYVNARLAELESSNIPYKIKGFLWHQGEGDMNPTMADIYDTNLEEFIEALRADFGRDLSVFIASVYNPNSTIEEGEAVRKAQRNVAAADSLAFVVNLDSVYYDADFNPNAENLISDNIHYNSTGQIKIGNSFANTFLVFNPLGTCVDNDSTSGTCSSPTNLALNKATTQSSTYANGVASLAVDGNRAGTSPWTADLQHTNIEFQPWWQVDLGEVSAIEELVIYNRTDCCSGRLNNFYILYSNQPFDTAATLDQLLLDPNVSHVNFSGNAGLLENIEIDSIGRYVRLQHTREIQLHIPEIEVMGCPVENQGNPGDSTGGSTVSQTLEPKVSIFPNPTNSEVTLQVVNVDKEETINYSLYTLTGQKIWHKQAGIIETLDVGQLTPGTYFVKVQGSGWTQTEKLLVR